MFCNFNIYCSSPKYYAIVSFKAQNVATNLSAIIFPEMISTLADFL
jgi:hypothetical protein